MLFERKPRREQAVSKLTCVFNVQGIKVCVVLKKVDTYRSLVRNCSRFALIGERVAPRTAAGSAALRCCPRSQGRRALNNKLVFCWL
jgi:hypothetical protein